MAEGTICPICRTPDVPDHHPRALDPDTLPRKACDDCIERSRTTTRYASFKELP